MNDEEISIKLFIPSYDEKKREKKGRKIEKISKMRYFI